MQQHVLKDRIVALLAEAEQSPELMDRTDYQHLLGRLGSAIRELLEMHERLEEEHQEMAARLNRAPSSARLSRELNWPQYAIQHEG